MAKNNFDVAIKKSEVLKYRCRVPDGYVPLSSILGSLPRYADDDAAKAAGLKKCELYINEFGNITAYGIGAQSLTTYVSTFEFNEATNSLTVNLANGDVQQIDLSDLEVNDSEILSDFSYNQLANQVTLEYVDGTTEVVTVPAPVPGETISFVEYTEGSPNTIVVTYTDGSTSTPITVTGITTQTPVVQSVVLDLVNDVLVVTSVDSLGNTVVENIPLANALQFLTESFFFGAGGGQFSELSPLPSGALPRSMALTVDNDKSIFIGPSTGPNNVDLNGRNHVVISTRPGSTYKNEISSAQADRNFIAGNSNTVNGNSDGNTVIGTSNTISNARAANVFGFGNQISSVNSTYTIGRANKNIVNNNSLLHTNTVTPIATLGDLGHFQLCMKSVVTNVPSASPTTLTLRDVSNNSVINFGRLYSDFNHAILNVNLKVSAIAQGGTLDGEGFTSTATGLIRLNDGGAPDIQLTETAVASTAATAGGASMSADIVAVSTDNLQIEVTVTPGANSMNVHAYGVLEITYTAIA